MRPQLLANAGSPHVLWEAWASLGDELHDHLAASHRTQDGDPVDAGFASVRPDTVPVQLTVWPYTNRRP